MEPDEAGAMSDESEWSSEELSSDEELQADFAKGELKPGLIKRVSAPKTYVNNVSGLRAKLAELQKRELDWIERMDVTVPEHCEGEAGEKEEEGEDSEIDPEDDFKREMHFLRQAQASAVIGLRKLEELGVPTTRPDDYFAEMVKNDDHMRKVRESLLSRQKVMEQKEKFRKLRELKKYGKKVQQEILQKRREDKKAAMESVKRFRKGKGERPSFLSRDDDDDDGFPVEAHQTEKAGGGGGGGSSSAADRRGKSKKRLKKDHKFGFGGKKKWLKSNTAQSSADMSGFRSVKDSKVPGSSQPRGRRKGGPLAAAGKRGKGSKTVKRLGKGRRQKMKLKR